MTIEFQKLFTRTAHNEGAEIRILGVDGKFTDFYITLRGVDSDAWRNRKSQTETPADVLADMTVTWRGVDVEFSRDMAKTLYVEAPYIADQVAAFFYKRENFTKPASQS